MIANRLIALLLLFSHTRLIYLPAEETKSNCVITALTLFGLGGGGGGGGGTESVQELS